MCFTALTAICLATTAATIACLLSMAVSKLFLHKPAPGRLTAASVLFSISIVAVTLILLFTTKPLEQIKSLFSIDKIIYYSIICVVAFVIAIFYRVLLPIGIVLYLIYCMLFLFYFFTNFDRRNSTVELKITSDTLFYGTTPYNFEHNDTPHHFLVIKTLTVSDSLLLPLPNTWFQAIGVTNERDTLPDSLYNDGFEPDTSIGKKITNNIYSLLEKNGITSIYYLEIPDNGVYPTIYNLKISTKGLSFFYELNRLF